MIYSYKLDRGYNNKGEAVSVTPAFVVNGGYLTDGTDIIG